MTSTPESPSTPQLPPGSDTPDAIVAMIPQLLGFAPESSFIVIGAQDDGTVKVTMRYDLPDPADAELAADLAAHAASILAEQHLALAVSAGYGPENQVAPVTTAMHEAASAACIDMRDMLRVDDGRYWSYACDSPAEGIPYDPDADAPGDGGPRGAVLASRAARAAALAPVTGLTAESMRGATCRARQHITDTLSSVSGPAGPGGGRTAVLAQGLAAVTGMIGTYRAGGSFATDYQIAWLTVVLKDLRVRDDAWARMDPRHNAAHQRLWTDVVRRAQPGHVAPAASLLAFTAWQAGDGVLANIALDRALADDPRYSMATLLRQVISAGAPPSLARVPMTPEEVAAYYGTTDDQPGGGLADDKSADDSSVDDEPVDEESGSDSRDEEPGAATDGQPADSEHAADAELAGAPA